LISHGVDDFPDGRETPAGLAGRRWRGDMEIEVLLKKHDMAFKAGGTA
jgi:hypothetical protein